MINCTFNLQLITLMNIDYNKLYKTDWLINFVMIFKNSEKWVLKKSPLSQFSQSGINIFHSNSSSSSPSSSYSSVSVQYKVSSVKISG